MNKMLLSDFCTRFHLKAPCWQSECALGMEVFSEADYACTAASCARSGTYMGSCTLSGFCKSSPQSMLCMSL